MTPLQQYWTLLLSHMSAFIIFIPISFIILKVNRVKWTFKYYYWMMMFMFLTHAVFVRR